MRVNCLVGWGGRRRVLGTISGLRTVRRSEFTSPELRRGRGPRNHSFQTSLKIFKTFKYSEKIKERRLKTKLLIFSQLVMWSWTVRRWRY